MIDWTRIARIERLKPGQLHRAFLGSRRIVVTLTDDGFRAFPEGCPHAGAPLSSGTLRGCRLTCHRHDWTFDVRTGDCPEHPLYSLRLLETRIVDGWLEARDDEIF